MKYYGNSNNCKNNSIEIVQDVKMSIGKFVDENDSDFESNKETNWIHRSEIYAFEIHFNGC